MFSSAPKPVAPPPDTKPVAPPPTNSGAQAIGEAIAPGMMSAIQKRKALLDSLADGYAPGRRGVAQLEGPGTTTSDSIHGVSLSRGEAVLPAKTVKAVGPDNVAALIEQTNGKAPQRGLRGGMQAARGALDDVADDLLGRKKMPGATSNSAFSSMANELRGRGTSAGTGVNSSTGLPEYNVPPEMTNYRTDAAAKIKPRGVSPQTNPLGASADAINFNGIKPPPAPADTSLKGRAQSAWSATKGLFNGAHEAATNAPPKTPAEMARSFNPNLSVGMPGADGVRKAAEVGGKWVGRAGRVATPVAAAMDASDVVDVATDKNMTGIDTANEVASKAGKWGAAGAGAIAGASAGAFGGPLAPLTVPLGAAVGGLTGYFASDAAIKAGRGAVGTETRDPSQYSNGIVSQALGRDRAGTPLPGQTAGAQTAGAGAQATTAPGELTDAQLAAKNADMLAASDRSLKAASFERPAVPQLGDERNVDALAGTRDVFSAARSRDGKPVWQTVSTPDALARMEQSKRDDRAERDAAADRAMNGPTSYKAQLRNLQERRANDALQQIREAAMWNPRAAKLYKSLMQTQSTVQGHQLSHDATLRSAAMQRDASMYGHDVSRANNRDTNTVNAQGDELQYKGTMGRIEFERGQAGIKRGVDGAKAVTDDLKSNPHAYRVDEKGQPVFDPGKAARLSKYMAEVNPLVKLPDGRTLPLNQARELYPQEAQDAEAKASNDFALRELAHEYSKEAVAGKGTQTGPVKLGAVRKINPTSDIVGNDTHFLGGLKTAAMSPFTGGNVVEVKGIGGRTIALPMDVIMQHPQGREMLESINRNRELAKQPPVDVYGNIVK